MKLKTFLGKVIFYIFEHRDTVENYLCSSFNAEGLICLGFRMSVDEIFCQNTQNQSYLHTKQSRLKKRWLSPAVNMMTSGVIWEEGLWASLWGNIFISLIEKGKPTYCKYLHSMGWDPRP